MNAWMTLFRKDVRTLVPGWFIGLGITVIVVAAVATASYFQGIHPGIAFGVGILLLLSNVFVLPVNLFKGLNRETKQTPALWLQTPLSGWSLLSSKLLSSLLVSLVYAVIAYAMSLALFHIDLAHAMSFPVNTPAHIPTHGHPFSGSHHVQPRPMSPLMKSHLKIMINQMPLAMFYAVITLLCIGLYISLWVSLIYLSMQAFKYRLNKFRWLLGIVIVLVATWGLGALEHSPLYHHAFGWGRFSGLSLFPNHFQSIAPMQPSHMIAPIHTGYIVFDVLVMVILFYIAGRLVDRHMEV